MFIKNLVRAWEQNLGKTRQFILFGTLGSVLGLGCSAYVDAQHLPKEFGYIGVLLFGTSFLLLLLVAVQEQVRKSDKVEEEIREVEEKARANPEKPEYAWDLARTKLERYLDRNLYEVRAIFFLTTSVMFGGFALIVYGLWKAFGDPTALPVSVVSAASGVLLTFVGGSFMLIYRSVLAQSANYVTILERINAVGMAVQIASTVPDGEEKLRAETTAALAKSLLTMYGTTDKRVPRKTAG